MQKSLCLSVKSSFSITGSFGVFLFRLAVFFCGFFVATFFRCVAFFDVALRCHFSRLFLLRMVESLTPCFSAKALNVMSDVSHSFLICSQFGFGIYIHRPPPLMENEKTPTICECLFHGHTSVNIYPDS